MNKKRQAGKGSRPRNIFSKNWVNNFDQIDWGKKKKEPKTASKKTVRSN